MKLTVSAGAHTRKNCPIQVTLPARQLTDAFPMGGNLRLNTPAGDHFPVTLQFVGENAVLYFVLDYLGKYEQVTLTLDACNCGCRGGGHGFALDTDGEGLNIYHGDVLLAAYHTKDDIPKPYLGHLRARYGTAITRIDPNTFEHPHHRALWISHGDVNGVDTWNEPADTHGYIRVQSLSDGFAGKAAAGFTAHNLWTDHSGKPLCDEQTAFTFFAPTPAVTVIDVDITLSAAYGDVVLGPTKEAGPLAVRMADDLTVQHTGTFVNAEGGINEEEIWMKPSPWVDYYGKTEGYTCGIAIMDSPENKLFPTLWHARNYGLMAVNNFYMRGAETVPAGGSRNWKFRVIAHSGDTEEACIKDLWADWASAPAVTVENGD